MKLYEATIWPHNKNVYLLCEKLINEHTGNELYKPVYRVTKGFRSIEKDLSMCLYTKEEITLI